MALSISFSMKTLRNKVIMQPVVSWKVAVIFDKYESTLSRNYTNFETKSILTCFGSIPLPSSESNNIQVHSQHHYKTYQL